MNFRDNKLKIIAVLVIFILIVTNITMFVLNKRRLAKIEEEHQIVVSSLESELSNYGNAVNVYFTTKRIRAGEPINKEDLITEVVPSSMFSTEYITNDKIFDTTLAKVDIQPRSPILNSMLMPELVYDGDRYFDIVADNFPVHLEENQFIDYVLTAPFGEQYIVMSKKRVLKVEQNSVFIQATQEDMTRYSSALIDAFLNPGTTLSATIYVEPGLQNAAKVYYPVSEKILRNMELNPNIVEVAQKDVLERRRQIFMASLDINETEQAFISAGRQAVFQKLLADMQEVRARGTSTMDEVKGLESNIETEDTGEEGTGDTESNVEVGEDTGE